MRTVFETERLIIRKARPDDADVDFFYRLWTNPKVMTNVGFPSGLKITPEEIREKIAKETGSEYNGKLLVDLKATGETIGECKLGLPDGTGVSETDVKLMPEFWGNRYGVEIKQGLVDYLFTHTECKAVKATPNKNNAASIRMQEAVGGKRVAEGVFNFPVKMKSWTCDVPYYEYRVTREDWENSNL
jgi:RimJ/RimL family protein N-acetyltransferase